MKGRRAALLFLFCEMQVFESSIQLKINYQHSVIHWLAMTSTNKQQSCVTKL